MGTIWHLRKPAVVYCKEAQRTRIEILEMNGRLPVPLGRLDRAEDGFAAVVAKDDLLPLLSGPSNSNSHQNKGTIY